MHVMSNSYPGYSSGIKKETLHNSKKIALERNYLAKKNTACRTSVINHILKKIYSSTFLSFCLRYNTIAPFTAYWKTCVNLVGMILNFFIKTLRIKICLDHIKRKLNQEAINHILLFWQWMFTCVRGTLSSLSETRYITGYGISSFPLRSLGKDF